MLAIGTGVVLPLMLTMYSYFRVLGIFYHSPIVFQALGLYKSRFLVYGLLLCSFSQVPLPPPLTPVKRLYELTDPLLREPVLLVRGPPRAPDHDVRGLRDVHTPRPPLRRLALPHEGGGHGTHRPRPPHHLHPAWPPAPARPARALTSPHCPAGPR